MRATIADYETIEAVAAGPPGEACYLCRAPARMRPDEQVAVSELAVDAAGWQQLADHVARLANVASPDLLRLLEVGPDVSSGAAGVYLASEHAKGGSLARPYAPLDAASRVAAVAAAARAAHAMHEAGLAHGSISPASILLTSRGPVLAPPRLGAPPGLVCTYSTWPELVTVDPDLLCGEYPSRGSDVWSVGASLHCTLTNKPLYPGIENDEAVTAVQRILFTRPEPDPALPGALRAVVAACLAADPAERPGSALEVAERISGALP